MLDSSSTLLSQMKQFMRKGLVDEFHLCEICQLSAADNFSLWLTTSQAWEELAEMEKNPGGGLVQFHPETTLPPRLDELMSSSIAWSRVFNRLKSGCK